MHEKRRYCTILQKRRVEKVSREQHDTNVAWNECVSTQERKVAE
jgi:hypothetical protein